MSDLFKNFTRLGFGFLFTVHVIFAANEKEDSKQEGERLFSLKVKQIFSSKCFACHGGDPRKIKGEFDLTTQEGLLKGGESEEPGVVPGKPEASPIVISIERKNEDFLMPPKENDKLDPSQVEVIKRWVELGALWPDAKTQARYIDEERTKPVTSDGMLTKTSGGLSDEWTYRRYQPADLWAFQPVKKPRIPKDAGNPIDAFVDRKLKAAGFAPASQADFRTLVKRAYYALTGLPPTPYQIYQFRLQWDKEPDQAWDKLINQLLASPHYGERWAQHWLDVARYADTGGYSNDYERSNAWRYRDYVIRSFNNDKPYNEFVVEQIAGDELWEIQPENKRNSELLVAASFLRMGPWDPAMTLVPQARHIYLDDVVNSVGQTFLSTTMRCVKCHDHKFDPVPTRDYYRMYAVFAGVQMAERPAPFLEVENRSGLNQKKAITQRLWDYAKAKHNELYQKQEVAARKWYAEHGKEYLSENARRKLPDEEKPPRHVGLSPEEQGRLKVRMQDEWIWKRRLERYQPMVQGVYNGSTPKNLNARSMRMPNKSGKNVSPVSHILLGGALEAPGEEVGPGVLSALNLPVSTEGKDPYRIADKLQGRRLALANWIAHPKNPLTARSIVNRVWQHHFGKPLAANPNNFGAKGGKPTHPDLLDWLAADFVEHGWKFKRLHRLIMSSATYRQSGRHPNLDKLKDKDPDNILFAFHPPRRLSAEEMRDSLLASTGELNRAQGGFPVMPEINMEVALQPRMIQFSIAPAYQPSRTPAERNRRTVYAYRVRGQADPFLELFNQPNPNASCEERDSAAVTPQAFTLLNSEVMSDRSIAMALRVEKEFDTLHLQVKRAVQLAFGRVPDKEEWERLKQYVIRMQQYHAAHHPEKVVYPKSITRSLVEELTGQPFEYKEILPVFENYVPDKKPADVNAGTRALADLCLLLFNSNEFIYVY
jgi:mono/diheme cytochrome c family protein